MKQNRRKNRRKTTILALSFLLAVISFTSILADESHLATGSNAERGDDETRDENTSNEGSSDINDGVSANPSSDSGNGTSANPSSDADDGTSTPPSSDAVNGTSTSPSSGTDNGVPSAPSSSPDTELSSTLDSPSTSETQNEEHPQSNSDTGLRTGAVGLANGTAGIITSLAEAELLSEDEAEVFQVVLPVVEDGVFDFIIDPQELIEKTDAAAYDGKTFEKGATVFFANSSEERENDYSRNSEYITIINKGAVPVEVILTAKVSPSSINGVAMSEDIDFTDNTAPSLYLALTDGENTEPVDEVGGAEIQAEIPAAGKGQENKYSFWLTGAANKNSDWSEVSDVSPKITVIWTVRPLDLPDAEEENE